jgi:hypothetical protein
MHKLIMVENDEISGVIFGEPQLAALPLFSIG